MSLREKAEPLTFHARAQVPGATYHTLGFIIPRRLVDALLASPDRSGAMVLDGRLPLVALLRRYLYAAEGRSRNVVHAYATQNLWNCMPELR